MKALSGMAFGAAAALMIAPAPPSAKIEGPISTRPYQELAATCPKTGEQISGMNKICFYNCVGSMTAITVSAVQVCPLSIQG